jgi:hypothetical protein
MVEKRHAEVVTMSKRGEAEIGFGDAVLKDFERLHEMLKDSNPEFDWEMLRHLEDFSKKHGRRTAPIAFAAITQVFQEVTKYAVENNKPYLLGVLEDLSLELGGQHADRTPIKISFVTKTR